MSAIEKHINAGQTYTVRRLQDDGDIGASLIDVGTIKIHLQPVDALRTAYIEQGLTVTHRGWTYPTADIKVDDHLVAPDNSNFIVRGIRLFDFSTNPHTELTLEKEQVAG